MPGVPFLYTADSYQGVAGEGIPEGAVMKQDSGTGINVSFWVWLVVIGVIIPAIVLGGLRAGGFQFVFRRR